MAESAARTAKQPGKIPAVEVKSITPASRPDGWRETVESVVVAFVLAFLFRTFEAEAFVIPTGSMAPTLYGQNRDIHCSKCGTRFALGASSMPAGDAEIRVDKLGSHISADNRSHFAVCPNANCRFPNDVLNREIFAGDRILVNKFSYELGNPDRFDVAVFKYPEGAKTNYIKRIVGLPGEEVRLEGGDVKSRQLDSDDPFRIARKDPDKQRTLQLLVHDNDAPARELLAAGWPEAWSAEGDSSWSADTKARSFRVDPDALAPEREQWLRYTNYNPTADEWTRVLAGQPLAKPPTPVEVRDFYGYNARISARDADLAVSQGKLPDLVGHDHHSPNFVGDLTLSCAVEVFAAEGTLILELVEGARRYRCQFDLTSGAGSFWYQHENDRDDEQPRAAGEPFESGMKSGKEYELCFANVDDRLCLWVDGRLIKSLEFNEGSRFEPPRQPVLVTERDRAPAGIGARGAKLRVSHLRIERDIFYINEDPSGQLDRDRTFRLKDTEDDREDEFLMLGDNSPRSNDSRAWRTTHAVSRRLLIGRAFFIYWPHGVPFLNDGRGYALLNYQERANNGPNASVPIPKFSAPFYPQVGRMRRIR